MADEDPEERRHPPAFKQQLTKDMMNATGMLQEQAKSFLKTYDWNFEAAKNPAEKKQKEDTKPAAKNPANKENAPL